MIKLRVRNMGPKSGYKTADLEKHKIIHRFLGIFTIFITIIIAYSLNSIRNIIYYMWYVLAYIFNANKYEFDSKPLFWLPKQVPQARLGQFTMADGTPLHMRR